MEHFLAVVLIELKPSLFCALRFCTVTLQFNARIGSGDVLEKWWRIFADDGLGVVASNVVPLDTIFVDVIEHTQTRFFGLVDFEFGIVRLWPLEVASGAPRLVTPTGRSLVGLGQLDTRTGPEPSVDQDGLQVLAVATSKVAQTATGPDVGQFLCVVFW